MLDYTNHTGNHQVVLGEKEGLFLMGMIPDANKGMQFPPRGAPVMVAAAAAAAPIMAAPVGPWVEQRSPMDGRVYWHNTVTQEKSWVHPAHMQPQMYITGPLP